MTVDYRLLYEHGPDQPGAIDRSRLADLYRHPDPGDRPWVRTNFVSTLDGSAQGPDGRAGTINTAGDRLVFALQRCLAEVILVGAGTARAEHYRAVDLEPWQRDLRAELGLSPAPTLAIVSRSRRLPADLGTVTGAPGGPVLIITGRGSASGGHAFDAGTEVVEVGPDRSEIDQSEFDQSEFDQSEFDQSGQRVPLGDLLTELARRGLRRVLCEGGPQLNGEMHRAGLVDEICLTLSPMIIAGDGLRTTAGPAIDSETFRLQHCIAADDSSVLLRYLRITDQR